MEQIFHAVGHGTFSTGEVDGFKWVYDCGAKAKNLLKKRIKEDYKNQEIDMVVLSHFDDDHINGLECLLENNTIKKLVLPYTTWENSFMQLLSESSPSEDVFKIATNIDKWIIEKELNQKVGQIVFIKAGEINTLDNENYPFLFNDDERTRPVTNIRVESNDYSDFTTDYEFLFFNIDKTYGKFKVKGLGTVDSLKEDIRKDLQKFYSDPSINFPDWLKKIKAKYRKHFYGGHNANNDISLCMYVGKKLDRNEPYTYGFKSENRKLLDYFQQSIEIHTLYTGDITLNPEVIADMQNKFSMARWEKLNIVQIPHHGSKHSWQIDPSYFPLETNFIQCSSLKKHHPHESVLESLKGEKIHDASKKSKVLISKLSKLELMRIKLFR